GTPFVRHELDGLHESHPAYLADAGALRAEAFEVGPQLPAAFGGVAHQPVALDVLDGGQRGGHGHGVAAEGREREVVHRRGDLGRRDSDAHGVAVGDALGERHDVGLHAPVPDRAHANARAAPAGLHLVDDQQAARLFDDGLDAPEVVLRRHDEASDALDGLGDGRRDAPLSVRVDDVPDLRDAQVQVSVLAHAGRTPEHVRVADVLDVAGVDQAGAPRRLAGGAHGRLGAPAVAMAQGDDV